jgi:hypothetical protein
MVESSMETGRTTRWRGTVSSPGQMVDATRASTSTTRKRAMAHSSGLMAGSTRATGKMGSNTESEFTHLPQERPRGESGTRERGSPGLIELSSLVNN